MKPKYAFIFAVNLVISCALAGLVVVLFSKEQAKEREIEDLQTQQQVDRQKALKAREDQEAQKQQEAQAQLEAQKEVDTQKKAQVDGDLEKIDVCLKRVLDTPSHYSEETKAQRDTQEELLRQLSRTTRAQIDALIADMEASGFSQDAGLKERLDAFFRNYDDKIHAERMSYDFIDLGFQDSDRKRELDAESAQSLQGAFAARQAIRNFKGSAVTTATK